jgi:hypothetical protein
MRNNERIVDSVVVALFWVFVCCPLWKVALPMAFLVGLPPSLGYKSCLSKSPNPCTPNIVVFLGRQMLSCNSYAHAGSTDLISSTNYGAVNHNSTILQLLILPCTFDAMTCHQLSDPGYSTVRAHISPSLCHGYEYSTAGIHYPAPRSHGASPLVRKSICCFWCYDSVVVDSS